MKRQTKNKLKLFSCGALTGAVVLLSSTGFVKYKIEEYKFKDQFSIPRFEESFKDTKIVEQYTFDFHGQPMTLQADSFDIYSFDNDGNISISHGKKVEVPIDNQDYLLDEYITELEAKVYKVLKLKDKIKNQYSVYVVFSWMEDLYEEYLSRSPFDTLENRKEAIYKTYYDYIISNQGYTMGGYKFSDLEETIQKDIKKSFTNVNFMKEKGRIKEETKLTEFIEEQGKRIKYELFRKGRE
ncbi:MAG: hypothetical protein PHW32_00785 [Bacilli bacterium]|nr:hypothetical protein [Bacilli bacterium]MDD4282185.1 hypothetical protein [Bacilli bacterium]MDD4718537.1 hypothetical protein [Bacilli bacterium]